MVGEEEPFLGSPMEVTISGNLAAYLRMLAADEDEIRGVNKIALDCIVESLTEEVKADRGYSSNEQAEMWLFDGWL
jgi:hypothetical protein